MKKPIKKITETVSSIQELPPKIYTDVFKPAAEESGKFLERIPRAVNAALEPIDVWILTKEVNLKKTKKMLEQKLKDVDPDAIVNPETYVAVPALQAISYSMDSEELRNLYANLISKAMVSYSKDEVHPAFVEIIKQLSPFDAKLINSLFNVEVPSSSHPIIKIRKKINNEGLTGVDQFKHIISPDFVNDSDDLSKHTLSIDNLIRLNIIVVDYTKFFAEDSLYHPLEKSDLVRSIEEKISKDPTYNYMQIKRGTLELSDLGKKFIEICVFDIGK